LAPSATATTTRTPREVIDLPDQIDFTPIDPSEFRSVERVARPSPAYLLIMNFMKSGQYAATPPAALNLPSRVAINVTTYARKHLVPVRALAKGERLLFQRLDIDANGQPIENWQTSKEFLGRKVKRSPNGSDATS
jgi:hypothetical protein